MRFNVRDLLWMMVVVGMGLGWWTSYTRMQTRHSKRSEYIEKIKDELRMSRGCAQACWAALTDERQVNMSWMPADLPPDLENEQ
jgi:hypothetical protein